jgi:hypothetical protein
MMSVRLFIGVLLAVLIAIPACEAESSHPRLLLSAEDVALISHTSPLPSGFDKAVQQAKKDVNRYLEALPDVPVPKDAGGGYTHEQHKRNSVTIQNAGFLYQITGNRAYVNLAKDMLMAYGDMYPGLGEHPQQKNQSPGKLFWQSLNEAVWLVTIIQGYDAIYDALTDTERAEIEKNLLRPMVSFISDQAPQTFDRIHNHGTWAVAAVGMTGYVIGNQAYVEKALYGLKRDGSAGFMKQLDLLFSPDGFYSEGPYYQRYALMPFLLFSKVIERNDPQRKIFEYRDGVLLKAVNTVIQLSYGSYFFPFNDALKDKGLDTIELCYGVAIVYALTGDTRLLSIAEAQNRIVLTGDGFRLSEAIESGKAKPFVFESMQISDGPDGDQGVVSILRSGPGAKDQAVVFKATGQGLGHGHFDKLNWQFYDNGNEIVTDYGAARFLNVEEKDGGRYLPENKTWGKQTVAHNTLVVDETSHFNGDWKVSQKYYPQPLMFDIDDHVELTSARMEDAYEGVVFSRMLAMLKNDIFPNPVILDVLKVESEAEHQYDLPLHFNGHVTHVSHALAANTVNLSALGGKNGYQHLWLRATADVAEGELFQVTWLKDDRFYTYSVLADADMEVLFTQTGAGDPNFNLRTEQGLILRAKNASEFTFISVLEPHGEYNGSREFTKASASNLAGIERYKGNGAEAIRLSTRNGDHTTLGLSWNADISKTHSVQTAGSKLNWEGFYQVYEESEAHE